jgi:hypothetical protein
MRPLVLSALWVLAGGALAAAVYWAFLNTPESTIVMLGLSLLLAIVLLVVVGTTTCGLLLGWAGGWQQAVWRRAVPGLIPFVGLLVIVAAVWWAIGRGLEGLAARSGEISAWFIAMLNWSDVRPLITAVRGLGEWLRHVAAPFVALVWLGRALGRRWQAGAPYAWMPRAGVPARLALATLLAALTLWAPLSYGLYWMPGGLPPTWVEPAVALLKFALIAIVAAVGFSLIVRLAARATTST